MKKTKFHFTALIAAVSLIVSCTQNLMPEAETLCDGPVELTASLQGTSCTKGQTAWTTQQENAVESWQLFVFNEDGTLDVCGESAGSGSITLSCTTGKKKVYALVNSPESLVGQDGIKTESELLEGKSALSENTAGTKFVMFGGNSLTLTTSTTLPISVDRICSKVYIDSIENKLTGSYGTITVKGIYLTNVAGDAVLGNDGYVPESSGTWYNKMGYAASGDNAVEALLSEASLSEAIKKDASSTKAHYFYCYPNKCTETSQGGQWSPRCTRLVVETAIEGDSESRRYYVISLLGDNGKGIERNKYYRIRKLVINHLGSTDPDEEADFGDLTVSVTVSDWGEGMDEETVKY